MMEDAKHHIYLVVAIVRANPDSNEHEMEPVILEVCVEERTRPSNRHFQKHLGMCSKVRFRVVGKQVEVVSKGESFYF